MISHFDYCEEDEEKCELCILYFKFMEIEKIQKSVSPHISIIKQIYNSWILLKIIKCKI